MQEDEPQGTAISTDKTFFEEPPKPAKTIGNCVKFLTQKWGRIVSYNEFTSRIELLDDIPLPKLGLEHSYKGAWTDAHSIIAAYWLEKTANLDVTASMAGDAITILANENTRHPVRDWLNKLNWDGKKRLDDWLIKFAGAKDNEVNRVYFSKWAISAVARVMKPGCQADHVLILEGAQGAGKSSFYSILGGEWYSPLESALGSKDAMQNLFGKWIVEMPELNAIKKSDIEKVKSFVTTRVDRFRVSYGKHSQDYPRHCVLGGSTNEPEWLFEDGSRRWWSVLVEKDALRGNLPQLQKDREQLWAEAAARYKAGETWFLPEELQQPHATTIEEKRVADPWESEISDYLKTKVTVTTIEILDKKLGFHIADITRGHQMRVGTIMKILGWQRKQVGGKWVYVSPKPPTLREVESSISPVIPGPWGEKRA